VQLQDSVIRRIEIIGEAVRNIPWEIKQKYPDIPWYERYINSSIFWGRFRINMENY